MGGACDHLGLDSRRERHPVSAYLQRHHDFLECGIAGALPDTVDRTLDLTGAREHAGERVRHREAEIVVAVSREINLLCARYAREEQRHQLEIFLWRCVTDGIRNVDGGCT